jgi:putative acetyltransferase
LAEPGDAQAVIAAINTVCAEKVYLLSEHYNSTPQWEAVLYQEEMTNCLLLVPVWKGSVIGWCRVFGGGYPKTAHVGDVGIGLLALYRGRGIGTLLMEQAIAWAQDTGLVKLTADTFATNARARALFEKMGFEETGIRRAQYRVREQDVDEILWERSV